MGYREASHDHWNSVWTNYPQETSDNWLDKFEDIIAPCSTPILDLGCGLGNNTFTLYHLGKSVIACDQSEVAVRSIQRKKFSKIEAVCFNMLDKFPFKDDNFDVIIADLSLHYFNKKDTKGVTQEIRRVLKPDGYLLFRVNSVNDTEHGAGKGKELEHHLYSNNGMLKRFFDSMDIKEFFGDMGIEYINEELMTRYTKSKWVYIVRAKNSKGY